MSYSLELIKKTFELHATNFFNEEFGEGTYFVNKYPDGVIEIEGYVILGSEYFFRHYGFDDFIIDITREGLVLDSLMYVKRTSHNTGSVDLKLSDGFFDEITPDSVSFDCQLFRSISEDIECLCFIYLNEDITKAIELYGERALEVIAKGL